MYFSVESCIGGEWLDLGYKMQVLEQTQGILTPLGHNPLEKTLPAKN